jgi:hypothetical protein
MRRRLTQFAVIGVALIVIVWVALTRLGGVEGGGPSVARGVVERASPSEICMEDGCFHVDPTDGLEVPIEGTCVELDLGRPTMRVLAVRPVECGSNGG